MQDGLETRRLGYLIEGVLLGNVRDDDDFEVRGLVLVSVADVLRLFLGADGGDDGVALLEELLEAVSW